MRWAPSVVTVHREVIGEFLTLSQTNPQSAEDHIGDPGRQQMKRCRNHHTAKLTDCWTTPCLAFSIGNGYILATIAEVKGVWLAQQE